jgi:hypothetical protein
LTSHSPQIEYYHLFFFFGFFFFTPPVATGALCAAPCSTDPVGIACGVGMEGSLGVDTIGRLFCIFSIMDRLNASKRLRKMDEQVLNFTHCASTFSTHSHSYKINMVIHFLVVCDFENESTLGSTPSNAVTCLRLIRSQLELNIYRKSSHTPLGHSVYNFSASF